MARPKLDKKSKAQLKSGLQAESAKGTPVARIVETFSRKYGLSGKTVRYHLKKNESVAGGAKAVRGGSKGGGGKASMRKPVKLAARPAKSDVVLFEGTRGEVVLKTGAAQVRVASVVFSNEKKLVSALRKSVAKLGV